MLPLRKFKQLPTITVQLPIYNELYVVNRLLEVVSRMDYPKELLQIQVLDDSTDETREIAMKKVEEMRAAGLQAEYIWRADRVGFKAGALEHGLKTATGEFILILDADFVPAPNLLRKTIDFFTDPQVGLIQTRWGHLNHNYSLLTRLQAMYLDGHLLLEQTARSRTGRFFNFNGTAGIWRRECIEQAGGWHHDTLTEDLDISYRAQLAGWKFVFLPHVVTPAELPVDMNGFKAQQHRWTKGSIQTCLKILPAVWKSRVSIPVKLEATFHLTSNFAYLLLACLCFLVYPAAPPGGWTIDRILFLDLPIFFVATFSVGAFYLCAQLALYPKTWYKKLPLLPLAMALGIGMSLNNARAVLEAVFRQQSGFTRTAKYAISGPKDSWKNLRYSASKSILPFLEVGLAVYFTVLVCFAILNHQFVAIPFLALFQVGFSYVAFCSFSSWGLWGQKSLAKRAAEAEEISVPA